MLLQPPSATGGCRSVGRVLSGGIVKVFKELSGKKVFLQQGVCYKKLSK